MKRYKEAIKLEKTEEETEQMPPRKSLHTSEKNKITRYFYNSLFVIFIVLIVGFLMWGFLLLNE